MLDPLIVDTLAVETVVVAPASAPPEAQPVIETFHLDSGATVSVLRERLGRELGARLKEAPRVALVDPLGGTRDFRRVIVPEVRVGSFAWLQVHAVIAGIDNLIGHDLLSQLPWEVDLDRGLLILDAAPWAAGVAQMELPVQRIGAGADPARPAWSRHDRVVVRLNGREVPMAIDTGATLSALPARLADSLEFAAHAGCEHTVWHGRRRARVRRDGHGRARVRRLCRGVRPLLLLPNDGPEGLLGLDVLRLFRFRVDSGRTLSLRRRGDRIETASQRIARWSWVPRCDGQDAPPRASRARVPRQPLSCRSALPYPDRPTSFLWSCAAHASDPARLAVAVFVPRPTPAEPIRLAPRGADPDWARAFAPCGALALVDVGPAGPVLTAAAPSLTSSAWHRDRRYGWLVQRRYSAGMRGWDRGAARPCHGARQGFWRSRSRPPGAAAA